MTANNFPPPDATREQIDEFYRARRLVPSIALSTGVEHEAPLVENGPSLVCSACEVVRIGIGSPFCKSCSEIIAACSA